MSKNKTAVFQKSVVSVKIGGKTHVFDAQKSLPVIGNNFEDTLRRHSDEYYYWREKRDKIKKKLRSLKFQHETLYTELYWKSFNVAEKEYNFVSGKVIEGLMRLFSEFETLTNLKSKLMRLEDELDKLESIVCAIEHRKTMLNLLVQLR